MRWSKPGAGICSAQLFWSKPGTGIAIFSRGEENPEPGFLPHNCFGKNPEPGFVQNKNFDEKQQRAYSAYSDDSKSAKVYFASNGNVFTYGRNFFFDCLGYV